VSTTRLMAQKPKCNLKLHHKNSVFSVPSIVTTSIIYYGICDFLTGSLWFIGHQIHWQLWFLMFRLHLNFSKKRWPQTLLRERCELPQTPNVYWGSAPYSAGGANGTSPDPVSGRWAPPSFVHFKHCLWQWHCNWPRPSALLGLVPWTRL
jgi:hypothetical protein